MPLRTLLKICTTVMLLLCTSLVASVPVRAATINITYSLTGMGTVTGMTSTSLDLTGAFTGSVDQANTAENAVWNPVTYNDVSQANLSTGLLNGTFSITFANGEMLSGMVGENVSAIISSPTGTGPFTQMLTFTAGTGEFAGVSGSASGTGFVGAVTGTVSGTGTLTAPGLVTPEPRSIALMLGGLTFIALRYRRGRIN
ncbi:MAG TPA: PEP-CTERM sorting domain-containing protein [Bryobacteraceae bacterium]|nr:PEP-CTERM sorting domain-containing protein [Bryobacteraceae bacterium]